MNTTAHPIELGELNAAPQTNAPQLLQSINPLHNVRASLQVCVGRATLTVGELMSATVQQVLVLDRSVQQAVDLLLDGHVVARGELVAVDDQFAVRITELPLNLALGQASSA
jgi:flagellar motor switch protein FliN/FliY